MGRGSVITSSGLDWERFGVITGGDEVCILPPPTLSEKGLGIPTFVHYPKKNVKTFRWDQRLQIQNLFIVHLNRFPDADNIGSTV